MIIKGLIHLLITVLIFIGGFVLAVAIIKTAYPKGANWAAYAGVYIFVAVLSRKLVDYRPS